MMNLLMKNNEQKNILLGFLISFKKTYICVSSLLADHLKHILCNTYFSHMKLKCTSTPGSKCASFRVDFSMNLTKGNFLNNILFLSISLLGVHTFI